MGDRVWTSVQFSGHATAEVAQGLVDELIAQSCQCDEGPEGDLSIEHLKLDTVFYDEECNYGQMDGVEAYCKQHNISYCKTWQSGGGFGEGAELYNAVVDQTFTCPTVEAEAAIGVSELVTFHGEGKTIEEVIAYLKHINNFRDAYPSLEITE